MKQPTRCSQALPMIRILLGQSPDETPSVTDREAEAVFLHVRRCTACKAALTAEQYSAFVSRVLLENE